MLPQCDRPAALSPNRLRVSRVGRFLLGLLPLAGAANHGCDDLSLDAEDYYYYASPNARDDYEDSVRSSLVELCAPGARDRDGDLVCDRAEAFFGTDPSQPDSDGDRLSDAAELGLGPVDLSAWGVDPLRKDVLVEIDYYPALKPRQETLEAVTEAFARAPVLNPDGSQGISLHLVLDDEVAPEDADDNLLPVWPAFDRIKAKYFDDELAPYFRYGLFANQHNSHAASGCSRGVPAHDFVISLGTWKPRGGSPQTERGTLMHEIGHLLGLQHGGQDNINYKPHYLSVMNYNYQEVGLTVDGVPGVLDFSRLEVASPSEAAFDEQLGFQPTAGSATSAADIARYAFRFCRRDPWRSQTPAGIDLDGDGVVSSTPIRYDLDCDEAQTDSWSDSQNDWNHLVYHGGGTIGDPTLPPVTDALRVPHAELAPCAPPPEPQ